ncbi:hypothetical protein ColLi_04403 [Colletotrichum liriopes]|uniref:Uncharacterized protein n=1 Tax=Colletotrichum liriopes TaxID=708192 RepID=A0AA37LQI1_9PEZI|nr:hypothetical protein ColLi_04403 [Colletotrichum liriopes]
MKLVFLPFAALLASTAASPISSLDSAVVADSSSSSAHRPWINLGPDDVIGPDPVPPNEGFVPDEQEEACLKMCPAIIPGLHPYKQPGTFFCRLRCSANAYRRERQKKENSSERKDRGEEYLADEGHELVAPQELDTRSLKKYQFWNASDTEVQSEYLTAEAALDVVEENSETPQPIDACSERPQYNDRIYLACEVGCAFVRPVNPLCKKGCIANAIMRCRVREEAETQAPKFESSFLIEVLS